MTDQLANTKAFLTRANQFATAKAKWDAYGTSGSGCINQAVAALYAAIKADDPSYQPGGPASEAQTATNTKAHVTGLVKALAVVGLLFTHSGGPTSDQAVVFGSNFNGTDCYLSDLIAAVKADDPTWTP
ncbi:hypothetical protein [Nocardia sp. NPDC051570]|uniref:hypothetical protein n=1 Tax=Nocardia sp. NPDC051570 TaxID=3364324 RepID=UPI0037915C3E